MSTKEEIIKELEKETNTKCKKETYECCYFSNYDGTTFIIIDRKYKILTVLESQTRCPDLSYKAMKLIIELMEV